MSGISPDIRRPRRGKGVRVDDDLDGSDKDIPSRDISEDESLSHSQDDIEPSDSASASDINVHPAQRKSRRHSRVYAGDHRRSEAQPRDPTVATNNPQRRPSRRTIPPDITNERLSGAAKTRRAPVHSGRGAEKLRSRFDLQPSPGPYSDADSYDYSWERYPPPPTRAPAGLYGQRPASYAPGAYQSQVVPYNTNPFDPFAPPQEGIPYRNPAQSGYSMHGYFSQPPASYLYHPPPPPPPPTEHPTPAPPPEAAKSRVEQEMERLRADMEAELRAKKEADKRRELEESIRREAEETMQRRMEAARRAQDDVRRELEKAKEEAETAARKRLEEERKVEEQRQIALAEERARASAEERARVQAALRAEELERERRKEEEMRMLKEAKEKALLELEAERERARREEAERANLLEELRAQVRQEMATEAARLARDSARSSTNSRSRHRHRGGSGYPRSTEIHVTSRQRARGVPPGPPNPPPPKFPPPPSAQTDSGEEDEVIVEERDHVTDDSDRSSTHWYGSSSSSLKSWRRHDARRRRQEEKDEHREIRMLGKELAPRIAKALIGHLPVAGHSYMPAPMPAFYMQHPPLLPSMNDPRGKHRAAGNGYLYSRYSSDETDESESGSDTITPRRSQRHGRPERQIGGRHQSRDTSIASGRSMGGRRGIRTSKAHSESNSRHKQDVGGSKVITPRRPSQGTDGITTTQELHNSGRNPNSDSNSQSTTTELELSKGEDPGEPLASAETNRELLVDSDIPDAESSNLDSQSGNETQEEAPTARLAHHFSTEAQKQPRPPSPAEDILSGHDISDTASVAFKPSTQSQASTSSKSGRQILVIDATATTDSGKEDTKSRNTPRGAVESIPRSPRPQRRLERLEKKPITVGERNHRNQKQSHAQDQDHRDRNELNTYSPFGRGTPLAFNHAEQEMPPVPLPYYYPAPYQVGMPSGVGGLDPRTSDRRTKSRTSREGGRSQRGERRHIAIPTMQPYGLLIMPSMFTPMLGPPSFDQ